MKSSILAASESSTTITDLPALLIILAIIGAIIGVGVLIGRATRRK